MVRKVTLLLIFFVVSYTLSSEELKIGLALSGGGARGLAHIGFLKVIDEIGLEIDYIAGTSMGAVIGGLYATGLTALEIENIFLNEFNFSELMLDTIPRRDYFIGEKRWGDFSNISLLIDKNNRLLFPLGLVQGNRLINKLFHYTSRYNYLEDFDNLPIPFAAGSIDLETGRTVIIRSGSLHEAIRASMSISSIYVPFEHQGRLLIDGGIKINLPAKPLSDMGANYIIGIQVASDLRSRTDLNNPIAILDQTINISSQQSRLDSFNYCSLLIEPEMGELRSTEFDRVGDFIRVGEEAARNHLSQLLTLVEKQSGKKEIKSHPLKEPVRISKIEVIGNENISSSKVREYSGISNQEYLSLVEIQKAVDRIYYSKLFDEVYPIIREDGNAYRLQFNVKEKPSKSVGFNLRYSENNEMSVAAVLDIRNSFGSNSNLLFGLSAGGHKEILTDYVKNFGREWGVYFRIFPYINEQKIFFYDDKQERIASSNAFEVGALLGIGAYTFNRYIVETYLYSYRKRLYRDIAETEIDQTFSSSGIGLKFYSETLDDLIFPMKGRQYLAKLSYADESFFSDFSYTKFYGRFQQLIPLTGRMSLRGQIEYGSYFDKDTGNFDPFYVGGFDSFMGMRSFERSAPIVKVATLSGRYRASRRVFFDLQVNGAIIGDRDLWEIDSDTLYGLGLRVGINHLLGPMRAGIGISDNHKVHSYLSLGYDFDAFEFSRR